MPSPTEFVFLFVCRLDPGIDLSGTRLTVVDDAGQRAESIFNERSNHSGKSRFSPLQSFPVVGIGGVSRLVLCGHGLAVLVVNKDLKKEKYRDFEAEVTSVVESKGVNVLLNPDLEEPDPQGSIAVSWVHRIIVNPEGADSLPVSSYGEATKLSSGCEVIVGDGYSVMRDAVGEDVRVAVDGIICATLAWVLIDDVSRSAEMLVQSARNHDVNAGGRVFSRINRQSLSEIDASNLGVRARSVDEFLRVMFNGLLDGRKAVYISATKTWQLTHEIERLIDKSDAYGNLARAFESQRKSQVDGRRNHLLFGLTFTSLATAVTASYEFLVGSETTVGPSPRPMLFIGTAGIGLAGACIGFVGFARSWWEQRKFMTEGLPSADLMNGERTQQQR